MPVLARDIVATRTGRDRAEVPGKHRLGSIRTFPFAGGMQESAQVASALQVP